MKLYIYSRKKILEKMCVSTPPKFSDLLTVTCLFFYLALWVMPSNSSVCCFLFCMNLRNMYLVVEKMLFQQNHISPINEDIHHHL